MGSMKGSRQRRVWPLLASLLSLASGVAGFAVQVHAVIAGGECEYLVLPGSHLNEPMDRSEGVPSCSANRDSLTT
jgi:hypothetical protein